jgi:hypothetical protein
MEGNYVEQMSSDCNKYRRRAYESNGRGQNILDKIHNNG